MDGKAFPGMGVGEQLDKLTDVAFGDGEFHFAHTVKKIYILFAIF